MNQRLLELPFDRLGLKPGLLQQLLEQETAPLPWRVAAVERGLCSLLGFDQTGELSSRRARTPDAAVVVGDWVVLDHAADCPSRIRAVLDRTTFLRRGATGQEGREQLLAANLDTVFVVSALAATSKLERRGVNARRIERYVAAVREGGIVPVVVLNKVDLSARTAEELAEFARELSARLRGLEVLCMSARDGQGVERLQSHLPPGDTVAFIGLSGVGKSSLINTLLGEARLTVAPIREETGKGRHTTTRRELHLMPSGALLIDTPGMRQFAVLSADGNVAGFDDIDELASACRFADCEHATEPGCAVLAAVARGALSADRLRSYHSIKQDAQRLRARHDAYARHQEHQAAKRFGRICRQAIASKRR